MSKKVLTLAIISLPLFFAGCSAPTSDDIDRISTETSGEIIPLQDLSFDWEDINIEGGNVAHKFKFKNSGEEDLIIKSATTSCMCTTAKIKLADGTESQIYGMHGNNPWGGVVKSGEEFEVDVIFDPMAHGPGATGPIMRSIFLQTSSDETDTEITVSGNVLSKEDYESSKSISGFIFKDVEYDFGVVKQSGGEISHDFEFEYVGENPINITATPSSCACTSAEVSKNLFDTGDTGTLTVTFDPNLHEEPEGKFFKTVSLLTEPSLDEQPEVKIWVEMDLDLGPDFYKLKEEHNDGDEHQDGI